MIRQRIGDPDHQRYLSDSERSASLQELRRHEIGGRPLGLPLPHTWCFFGRRP